MTRYLVQGAQYASVPPVIELALKVCEGHGDEMKELLADTAFSYARYGEETNMDPQVVFKYCLQFHNMRKELDDGTLESREDVATSHTSLAQGHLLLDQFEDAVNHCQACINLEAEFPNHIKEGIMSQFAHIYQAWAWIGLGDYAQAAALCLKVIEYRARKFVPDDQGSIKYLTTQYLLGRKHEEIPVRLQIRRLGLALQCLGNAREKQGLPRESLEVNQRALANFRAVIGPDSFRVAQINLKLAENYGAQEGHAPIAKSAALTDCRRCVTNTPSTLW